MVRIQRSGRWKLIAEWQAEALRRIGDGESTKTVAKAVGRSVVTLNRLLRRRGGLVRELRRRSALRLSLVEREEISRGLERGESCRAIALTLHRAPSSISREVRRCGGAKKYRAWSADVAALALARRPKPGKIASHPKLWAAVTRLLALRWSPEQISHALVREYPAEVEMHVSHETIYRSLYVQSRGSLRKELTAYLRTGRTRRRPRRRVISPQPLHDLLPISARPAEAADRAVPGHWEGDLLIGRRGSSQVGTLVERSTRYLMLLRLKGRGALEVRLAIAKAIRRLPTELRRSLTWDQGREMAEHAQFTVETGVQIYFCDPASPWQRGSNENTNGLLRQYFPKGMDLSPLSQAQLDAVARQLNGRPRETLGWRSPAEVLAKLVA